MRECGPRDCRSPGHGRSLQHLDKTTLSAEDYVAQEAWRSATPPVCCRGLAVTACGMTRHGTYGRKTPRGMRVARWYCRPCHRSFSALPGCLQARLAGTLASCEAQVVAAEEAGSLWACVRALYPEAIDLTSARRSLRRRVVGVHQSLRILVGLFPVLLDATCLRLIGLRSHLPCGEALVCVRELGCDHLVHLPRPVGFAVLPQGPRSTTGPPTGDGTM